MGMAACFAAINPETANRLMSNPDEIEDYIYPNDGDDEPDNYIDVDKAWHGIHFMLTQTAYEGEPPLSWAILGGEEAGEDVGYGPARFLTTEQVKQISNTLPSTETFTAAFAPEAMEKAEIYPEGIWVRDGEEALEYLVQYYEDMIEFYRSAASRGDGAILWLC